MVFVCEHSGCGKEFQHRSGLSRHKKINHSLSLRSSRVTCKQEGCDRTFTRKDDMVVHFKNAHTETKVAAPQPRVVCGMCQKELHSRSLTRHRCEPAKRGPKKLTKLIPLRNINEIKSRIANMQKKPTVPEVRKLVSVCSPVKCLRRSRAKTKYKRNHKQIRSFCQDVDIELKSNEDGMELPIDPPLTDLQILQRAQTDQEILSAMQQHHRDALDSSMIILSTSSKREKAKQKRQKRGVVDCSNRVMSYADYMREHNRIQEAKAQKKKSKTNKSKKRSKNTKKKKKSHEKEEMSD